MFLNQLKEENKELFLKVCVHASLSNGVFANKEKEMISEYCREMNISENVPECGETFDATLEELSEKATNEEKKIIMLEILGLVKSDGVYDEKEKKFMNDLAKGIKVQEIVLTKLNSLLDIYTAVCKSILLEINE